MSRSCFIGSILFFLLSITPCIYGQTKSALTQHDVLILYDSIDNTNWVGYLNSLFLANLIGHFDKTYTLESIEKYTKGELSQYHTTFYLGTNSNNMIPEVFIQDVLETERNIVWFRYHFNQLTQASPHFSAQYGFTVEGIDSTGYNYILYKKTQLTKNLLDPQLGQIIISNPLLATVPAMAYQTATGKSIPYVVHGNNLWYVADIPFTYLSENDRYLAFADLLYDMLDVTEIVKKKRALLRLEDIHPAYDTTILKATADYLYSQHVPFAIAVIPLYADPLGYYTKGIPNYISMNDAPDFVNTLKYMEKKGGTIILHGYTHQYTNVKNAITGASGDDYEFFRVTQDPLTAEGNTSQPIDEDSVAWVSERVTAARDLLKQSNLSASIWETPHYLSSTTDNYYFAKEFKAIIGRVHYFDNMKATHYAEQFYPYVIKKDYYGAKIIPENLGYLSPKNKFNFPVRTVDQIIESAKKNLVLRDAWASTYYHPYLGITYLQQLIPAIKALGYEFVPVSPDLI